MKKHFITGLVILLPLAVTLVIVSFLFKLLTEPFAGTIAQILAHYGIFTRDYLFITGSQIQYFISQIFILLFLFFFTVLLGAIARHFFVNYLLHLWDYLLHKIPLIRTVYKASKDVIDTLFASKKNSFKQVVLVPFPHKNSLSLGLLTQADLIDFLGKPGDFKVTVFVPTTPNPTSGFLMVYPKSEVIFLDMKVEDAFKFVISCGVVVPEFKPKDFEDQSNPV